MAVVDMWQPCCSIYNPQLAISSARNCCIRKVDKNTKGFQLKEETTWCYQIQGQMAITGIHHTDLMIYTNKGILIVPVEFNEQFWL